METSFVQPRAMQRTPLSALTKLTIAALLGFAALITYSQVVLFGRFSTEETGFVVVLLLAAGFIATGRRWAPALAALLSGLMISGGVDVIIHDLMHPEAFHLFVTVLLAVVFAIVGIVVGISATVQNYHSAERHTPRIMMPALAALAGLCLGAILVGAIPRESGAGINPTILANLPPVTTPDFKFEQTQLTAKVGETVALRLDNTHSAPHSFDIDELNVHSPAAPGQQGLILFTPTKAGTYTFYCAIPGHRELGMEGTLTVEQ